MILLADRGRLDGRVTLRIRRHDHPLGRIAELSHSGSLAVRVTPWGAWLVGSAAAPLGGDQVSVDLDLGPGALLELRSPAATLARPGPDGSPSSVVVRAKVGRHATLWWHPEPGIAGRGSDHHTTTRVVLANGSRLGWVEEFVLGRHGEVPGTWRSDLRIEDQAGRPIVASTFVAGAKAPKREPSVIFGGARAVSMLTVVDPMVDPTRWCAATDRTLEKVSTDSGPTAVGAALPLAGPGIQICTWGTTIEGCRRLLTRLSIAGGVPLDMRLLGPSED